MNTPRRFLSPTCFKAAAVVAWLALLLAAPAPVAAQDGKCDAWTVPERRARAANPIPADEANLEQGRQTYVRECASCHGETGLNDGAEAKETDMSCARLLTDPELLKRTDGELFWMIREGRGSMPNTLDVLRDQDRWMLVHYLRTLVARDPSP